MITTGQGQIQGSATIYQFPAGGRAALGGRRYGEVRMARDLAADDDSQKQEENDADRFHAPA